MCTSDQLESIRYLNLTTLQEFTIIESSNVDADHGVTVYEDTVYWTGFTRVYSTPITGGGNQTELHYMSNWWGRGITVVHPDLQPSNVTHFESEPPSSNSPVSECRCVCVFILSLHTEGSSYLVFYLYSIDVILYRRKIQ